MLTEILWTKITFKVNIFFPVSLWRIRMKFSGTCLLTRYKSLFKTVLSSQFKSKCLCYSIGLPKCQVSLHFDNLLTTSVAGTSPSCSWSAFLRFQWKNKSFATEDNHHCVKVLEKNIKTTPFQSCQSLGQKATWVITKLIFALPQTLSTCSHRNYAEFPRI